MEISRRRAMVIGVAGTIATFVVLFVLVGAREVLETLRSADPSLVLLTFGVAIGWLFAWSLMLRTVLASLDVDVPVKTSFLVYVAAVFANNVTPFGQAGGEPVAALLISKVSDVRYETGLVGIASVDICNVPSSLSLAFIGLGFYATQASIGDRLETAVGSAVVLITAAVLVLVLVWRFRASIVDRLPDAIAGLVARVSPRRVDHESLATELTERLGRLFENVERVATDRRRLATILGLSVVGWLCQVVALTAAFAAVGYQVPLSVALFAIPLGNLAGAAPLPGGLGGIEAAFVALLVPTTGIAAPAVTAAVLVFRGAVYWLPVVIGGGSMAAFGVRTVDES